jgi:hypothetical protein
MVVTVEVFVDGPAASVAGAPVIVQVRDTSLQDARASVLGEARGTVAGGEGQRLAAVDVHVSDPRGEPSVWVHVDMDRDGRVSRGDYITVQSYPVLGRASASLRVVVKRV